MNIRFFILLCLVAIFTTNIYAKNTDIISKYLQNLDSVAMDFVQVDTREASAEGKLIISKPHRFRCNYYAPYPLLILGNKHEIVVYDYQLEQTTRVSAAENLFNFLLADAKDWEKNFKVEDVIHSEGATLFKLYHNPTDRTISIILQDKPLELKEIIIDEPDGNIIEVVVSNIVPIKNIAANLFSLPNPDVFGKPKRLEKKEIEKKYSR